MTKLYSRSLPRRLIDMLSSQVSPLTLPLATPSSQPYKTRPTVTMDSPLSIPDLPLLS